MKCAVETGFTYTYMVSAHATAAVTVHALVKYTCTYCCAFTRGGGLRSPSASSFNCFVVQAADFLSAGLIVVIRYKTLKGRVVWTFFKMKGHSATAAAGCIKVNQEGDKTVPREASAFIKIMSNFIIQPDILRSGGFPGGCFNRY